MTSPRVVWAVSDLHIFDGSRADDFERGAAALALTGFILAAARNGATVVLAGDVFERLQGGPWSRISAAYPQLYELIYEGQRDGRIIRLRGNHDDEDPPGWPKAGYESILGDGPHRVYVVHGHQHDPFNSGRWRFVGRGLAAIGGWLERHVSPAADDKALSVIEGAERGLRAWMAENRAAQWGQERAGRAAHRPWADEGIVTAVAKAAYAHECKIAVFGHTHRAGRWEIGGVTVRNCGTWTGGRRDYVEVNTATGQVDVRSWA